MPVPVIVSPPGSRSGGLPQPSHLFMEVQPSSNVTSGVVFLTQPTVRILDAQNNPILQSGTSITAAISSGTGTLSGTTTVVTDTNGRAIYTNLAITGASIDIINFTAPSIAGVMSNNISVTDASSDAEPSFNSQTQTLLFQDNFDSYNTFADAVAGGWRGFNGGTTQDTTSDPAGSNLIVTGRGGTGKAIRLQYYGVANQGTGPSAQEGHDWELDYGPIFSPSTIQATPGHALYLQFYFRLVGDGTHHIDGGDGTDSSHRMQVKWLEFWRSDSGDRAQFSCAPSQVTTVATNAGITNISNGPASAWNFLGNGAGAGSPPFSVGPPVVHQVTSYNFAQQVRGPFPYQLDDGAWHRMTIKYCTQSAGSFLNYDNVGGARDGVAKMWVDGTLVIAVDAAHAGVTVPSQLAGASPSGYMHWCELAGDVDSIYVNNFVSFIRFGGTNAATDATWKFAFDYDDLIMWRD